MLKIHVNTTSRKSCEQYTQNSFFTEQFECSTYLFLLDYSCVWEQSQFNTSQCCVRRPHEKPFFVYQPVVQFHFLSTWGGEKKFLSVKPHSAETPPLLQTRLEVIKVGSQNLQRSPCWSFWVTNQKLPVQTWVHLKYAYFFIIYFNS